MYMSDVLSKFVKPALIPAGYIMNIAGKIIKDQRIELLGHYLTCNGKEYTSFDPTKLVNEIEKGYPIVFHILPTEDDNKFVARTAERQLDQILGKFYLVHDKDNLYHIEDTYRFYPWNGDETNFDNSESSVDWCSNEISKACDNFIVKWYRKLTHYEKDDDVYDDRCYKSITFKLEVMEDDDFSDDKWEYIKRIRFIKSKRYDTFCSLASLIFLKFSFDEYQLRVTFAFNDRMFYFIGKWFDVKSRQFKLSDKLSNCLTKKENNSDSNESGLGNSIFDIC